MRPIFNRRFIQKAVKFLILISLLCIIYQFLTLQRSLHSETLRKDRAFQFISNNLVTENNQTYIDMKLEMFGRFSILQDQVKSQKNIETRGEKQEEDKDNEIIDRHKSKNHGSVGKDGVQLVSENTAAVKDRSQGENQNKSSAELIDLETTKGIKEQEQEWSGDSGRGFLNLHIWDNVCEFSIESLKEFVLFPSLPKYRKFTDKTEINGTGIIKNSGIRVFGFLHPEQTGLYKFGISSEGNSELWLSNDAMSSNARKIAFIGSEDQRLTAKKGRYTDLPSQTSQYVNMKRGNKYFMEILYKQVSGESRVEVAWMTPNSTHFQLIPGRLLSLSINDSHVGDNSASADDYERTSVAMDTKGLNFMPFMELVDFKEAFDTCDYEPSYYTTKKLVRFQGARNKKNTHFAEVYPPDTTNETMPLVKREDVWWIENNIGNDVIDDETARRVEKTVNKSFEKTYKKDFRIVKMMSLERAHDKVKGDRYHIQLEVEDIDSGRHYEFSEFLYQPRGSGSLCLPRNFRWNKTAWVNIIVPLKNSGRWAMYFIRNIAEIIKQSLDPHVRVIIIDYESTDIDLEAVFGKTNIFPHTIVRMPATKKFNRAEALQRGAETVTDLQSILFMCDLHLTMPAHFIGTIRKHCVEGKMAFAPVVKRLKCGYYPRKPQGYWETLGFGLFALYKSDFDRVGGMNVKEFKGWGGEDWELLDRVLESRMEVERLKIPSFYHFFHPAYGSEYSRINVK